MTETKGKPVAQIEGEIEVLEQRIVNARNAIGESEQELEAITARRDVLSADAFVGDSEALEELARLEEGARQAQWSLDVATAAKASFETELTEQQQRLKEARQRVARDRLRELDREYSELVKERERIVDLLAENCRAINHLHSRRAAVAHETGDETLQRNIAMSPPGRDLRRFLERKLRLGIS